jgi:hypothetical protein
VIKVEHYINEKMNLEQKDEQVVACRVCILNIPGHNFDDAMLNSVFTLAYGPLTGAYVRDNKES